jgi:hypothetical protein
VIITEQLDSREVANSLTSLKLLSSRKYAGASKVSHVMLNLGGMHVSELKKKKRLERTTKPTCTVHTESSNLAFIQLLNETFSGAK